MVAGASITSALVLTGCKLTRAGYESAEYKVESAAEDFEIREYPELTLASTPMAGGGKADDKSFMRLFGYISGENEKSEKIAMTTPVFMSDGDMSFVLPKDVASTGAPKSVGKEVEIQSMSKGRYAAYRFSGGRSDSNVQKAKETLQKWVKANKLTPTGSIISAGYDPPFTPKTFQRNEVLVRIK